MAAMDVEAFHMGSSSEEVMEVPRAEAVRRKPLFLVAGLCFSAALLCLAGAVHNNASRKVGLRNLADEQYQACTAETGADVISGCPKCAAVEGAPNCKMETSFVSCCVSGKITSCVSQAMDIWSPFSDAK
eukprot:TRINITY_DN219_c0_g1_i2.p3 TRINITY_DN219_c0_g1~~TRINITY_DN219_c0_g1_i2.p3  ORF type:complete len:130 (+),score=33.41 TRINITY_DN219_c0_g1_i2:77-466(+)